MGGAIRILIAGLVGVILGLISWSETGPQQPLAGADAVPVRIDSNGFHTDLVMERAPLIARGGPLADLVADLGPGEAVRIGWGDARFYVDQSPVTSRLPDGVRALFAPDNPSVVMLSPLSRLQPGRNSDRQVELRLSPDAFEALVARIEASLDLPGGRPRLSATGPDGRTRFYASTETFWIGRMCNRWTAEVLEAAGLTVHPGRTIVAGAVLADARAAATLDTARTDD
ncbi:DUF2459 domain-containing protein [Brevundimonas sp.]|uniref:DUF2459 domain-containing protein n=1 Tax=Brevundimonas sp. TaxID=1871086 RepID=UPI003511A60C